jgi:hypothetical protein
VRKPPEHPCRVRRFQFREQRGTVDLERFADDRRALKQIAIRRGELVEACADRGLHADRQVGSESAAGTNELDDEKRMALRPNDASGIVSASGAR